MKVGQNGDKKQVLEELLELGMVLVAIDARATGVDVPDHLGIDPQLRLNLSWRFGRPMEVDAWGIFAELTFGGVPYGCKFPWDAIFLIVSHINGESYLFPDHVPKELLHQAAGEHLDEGTAQPSPRPKRSRPKLSLVPASEAEAEPAPGAEPESEPSAAPKAAPSQSGRPKKSPARPTPEAPSPDQARDQGAPAPQEKSPEPPATTAEGAESAPEKPARSRGHLRLIK